MPELLVDFITSLDGYGAAEGWPGWWGLQGPEYLAWLGEQPGADHTLLMGANTYRLMSGFAAAGEPGTDALAGISKVVFSSTLREPLAWPNTRLIAGDPIEAVRQMKDDADPMRTMGKPHVVPLALERRPRGPIPGGRLSSDHRKDRPRADLRRVPGCRARHGQHPDVRWTHPTPRIRPGRPHAPAGGAHELRALHLGLCVTNPAPASAISPCSSSLATTTRPTGGDSPLSHFVIQVDDMDATRAARDAGHRRRRTHLSRWFTRLLDRHAGRPRRQPNRAGAVAPWPRRRHHRSRPNLTLRARRRDPLLTGSRSWRTSGGLGVRPSRSPRRRSAGTISANPWSATAAPRSGTPRHL